MVTTIPVPGDLLEAIAVTADGGRAFVVSRHGSLIEIDTATISVTGITSIGAAVSPGDIAISGQRAYVTTNSSDTLAVLDISAD